MPRPKPQECECGEKATIKNVAREWVCEGCRNLEREARAVKGRYANRGRTRVCDLSYVPKEKNIQNFAEMYDTSLSTPLESLSRLEAMLADPQKTLVDSLQWSGVEPALDAVLGR